MATVASLLVKLGLDGKRFDKGVKKVSRGLDNLIKRFDRVGDIGKMTALATAASALTSLTAAAGPASGALLAVPAAALLAGAGVATLAAGLSGVGDAMAATGGTAAELEESLAGLAPAAQNFVRSFAGVRQQFAPIQQAVQQRLFGGLGEELSALATGAMPTLRTGMTAVASALNSLGSEAMKTMATPLFQGQLADIFDGTAKATESFSGVVGPLLTVLAQLGVAGLPLITRFNEWAAGALSSAAAFMTSEAGAARLSEIVTTAGDTLAQLGSIAANLGSFLGGIFGGASVSGGDLLTTIETLTAQWATWANSAQGQEQLGQIFALLTQVATDLLAILPGVAGVIGTIASIFTSLPGPVQSTVAQMLAWSMVLGPIAGKIAGLSGIVTSLSGGLLKLGQSIKSPDTALGKFTRKLSSLALSAGKGLGKLVGILGKLGVQALLMGARMLAGWILGMGPIGWIIAAIIALVALVIIYWDEIVAAITIAWEWIKQATVSAWNAVVAWLTGIWASIVATATAAWEWLKSAVSAAWNWLVSLFMTYHPVGILMSHWEQIKAAAAAAWAWIKAKVSALWNGLVNFISGGINKIRSFITNGFNAAKNIAIAAILGLHNRVVATIARVISTVRGIPGKIRSALGNLGSLLTGAGRSIIQGLINGVTGMIGSLRSKFSQITNMIPSWKGPMRVDLRLLEPTGAAIMSGLTRGIEGSLPGLRSTLGDVTKEIPSNVSASVRHSGGSERVIVLDLAGADGEMKRMIRKWVRTDGRGDVQVAFGR
ncbi:phage tail protein [Nocardiopsis sp. CA-288880]|uniref:phage tail protein n=1 Tax=Nocardiopsis sp. CA-288880 TaxID=3239995 RepID=UPI003D9980D1